jgi:uncharacterized membrane protein
MHGLLSSCTRTDGPGGAVACRRQRGAISVLAAMWLVVALAALGAIDVGNVFFKQRSLQSAADMSANAAAQVVDNTCSRAPTTATGAASVNNFSPSATGSSVTTVCGRWDSTLYTGPTYFASGVTPSNAVQVTLQEQVPYLFLGPARVLTATATAKATNIGTFTLGTTLVNITPSAITSLLNTMLGTTIGATSISLASYNGLANARFSVGDLMAAVGAGTVNQLLTTRVTAGQLAQFMLTALQTTQVANTNLSTAIGTLKTIINATITGSQTFAIGNTSTAPGLLSLGLADDQSALNATISPFDGLMVAAEIAQAGKAPITVASVLTIPGVTGTTLSLQVIQPPVLAVGEAGKNASGAWRTIASSAQIRAYVKVVVGTVSLSLPLPFPFNISLLSASVILPIYIDVAPGTAWLQSTQCSATQAASQSVIGVQTGIANICIGDPPGPSTASPGKTCPPATLVQATAANAQILSVTTSAAALPAVASSTSALTFDGVVGNGDDFQSTNSNAVGSVLYNATSSLYTQLAAPQALVVTLGVLPLPLDTSPILNLLKPLLLPTPPSPSIFTALDTVLVPVLQLLGAQIGVSSIHDLSLRCGQSQLVY